MSRTRRPAATPQPQRPTPPAIIVLAPAMCSCPSCLANGPWQQCTGRKEVRRYENLEWIMDGDKFVGPHPSMMVVLAGRHDDAMIVF